MNYIKKISIFLLVLTLGFTNEIKAQQIKGKVISSENKEVLPYANIAFYKLPINRIFSGGVSDLSGDFSIKIDEGKYNIKFQVVGFEEKILKNIEVKDKNIELGDIILNPIDFNLGEVEVTAQRSYIENQPGRQILNVGRDIAGGGGNLTQVLKIVPSVEVTPRGDISIRGNQNIKILINGKEMAYGMNPQTLLKQLPSATVDKVEIITNASVSEDPESAGGAINIILKKNSNDGFHYGLNFEAGMKPLRTNGGFTLNYAKNKFNFYLTYGAYLDNYNFSNNGTRTLTDPQNYYSQIDDKGTGKYKDIGHLIMGGIDFDLNEKNSFNLEFTHNRYNEDWEYNLQNNYHPRNEENFLSTITNTNKDKINFSDISLRYDGKPKENHKIESMIHYSGGLINSDRIITENSKLLAREMKVFVDTKGSYNMGEFTASYKMPVKENGNLEFGINSELLVYDATQENKGDYAEKNIYDYSQQKQSFYLIYKHKFGKLGLGAGIRPEYYKSKTVERVKDIRILQEYTSIFPNLQLEYKISNSKIVKNISLSYSKRIRRPEYDELNPIADYSNPSHIYQGNPALKPEFINSIEVAYSYLKGSQKINVTFFGRLTENVIQQHTNLLQNGGLITSFVNHKESKDIGVEINAKAKPIKIWEVSLGGSIIKNWFANLKDETGTYHKEGMSWSVKMNNYFSLTPKNDIQLQLQYYGLTQAMYYIRNPYFVVNIGYERKLFGGKATAGISLNDVFNSGGKEDYKIIGNGFKSDSQWSLDSRLLKVSFNIYIN